MNKLKINEICIDHALKDDIPDIVRLSFDVFEVQLYFMMRLGREFLIDFYNLVFDINKGHLFVARDNGKIIGFLIGYADTHAVSQALKRNMVRIGWRILCRKYRIDMGLGELINEGYKNFMYMSRPQGGSELISMAVDQSYQGKGIGRKLVQHFEDSLKGISSEYFIFTHSRLEKTLQFYSKMGCKEFERIRKGEIVVFNKKL